MGNRLVESFSLAAALVRVSCFCLDRNRVSCVFLCCCRAINVRATYATF